MGGRECRQLGGHPAELSVDAERAKYAPNVRHPSSSPPPDSDLPMPPRLNKRQQRELEELSALSTPQTPNPEPVSEEEITIPVNPEQSAAPKIAIGFAALAAGPSEEADQSEDDDEVPTTTARAKTKKVRNV